MVPADNTQLSWIAVEKPRWKAAESFNVSLHAHRSGAEKFWHAAGLHQLLQSKSGLALHHIFPDIKIVPLQGYTMSETLEAAPGDIVSETAHATTYAGATAATFEGARPKCIRECCTILSLKSFQWLY